MLTRELEVVIEENRTKTKIERAIGGLIDFVLELEIFRFLRCVFGFGHDCYTNLPCCSWFYCRVFGGTVVSFFGFCLVFGKLFVGFLL